MSVERVENMFNKHMFSAQKAFISEMRKLKDKLIEEFDASEKLEEIKQKSESKIRELEEGNQNYEIREKQLKSDLAIARSLVEDKEKLIKVLDPTGVGQRLICSFNVEEVGKLNKRIAELESKEKDLLETNTKLESEKAEQVKTIDELRKEVLAQKDRQETGMDRINELKEKIDYLESKEITQMETIYELESENTDLKDRQETGMDRISKMDRIKKLKRTIDCLQLRDKTQLETIDELESENADLQNAQERVTSLEVEMSLLKEENKKLKAAQSAKTNKSNDKNSNGSKRKAASAKTSQKRIKTKER